MDSNYLFNAFNHLAESFGRKLRNDIFVASYGENELRFFTEATEEEEQELIGIFTPQSTLPNDMDLFKEVTESI